MAGNAPGRFLSVGEIFDRGLSVFVRNWRPFAAIAMLKSASIAVNDWYVSTVVRTYDPKLLGSHSGADALQAIWRIFQGDAVHENRGVIWASIALAAVLTTISDPTIFVGAVRTAAGDPADPLDWLIVVLRRTVRLAGIAGLWLCALAGMVIAAIVAMFPVVMIATATNRAAAPLAVTISLIVMIAAAYVVLWVPFQWSLYVGVDENLPVWASFRLGLSKSLGSGRFWRTIGISVGLIVLYEVLGGSLHAANALVFMWTRSPIVFAVGELAIYSAFGAFASLVVATYFLDSRARDALSRGEEAVEAPKN